MEENAYGGGNNELQIYRWDPKNLRVEKGNLVIEAHNDNPNVVGNIRPYSSARIRTKHRGDWKYCRVEVRAKLPIGKGIWPAIWMLPTDEKYGGWASSGEIDIMELVGHEPSTYHGTLHYGGGWPRNNHTGEKFKLSSGTFADDFHIFSIDWNEGKISWAIDGKVWQTQKEWYSEKGKFPAPFDQRFHLIINLAVGDAGQVIPIQVPSFPPRCWWITLGFIRNSYFLFQGNNMFHYFFHSDWRNGFTNYFSYQFFRKSLISGHPSKTNAIK